MSVNNRIRHRLELQALELEELFVRNGLHAQVEGGVIAADDVTFRVNLRRPLPEPLQRQIKAELDETFAGAGLSVTGADSVCVTLRNPRDLQLCAMLEERLDLAPRMALLGRSAARTPLILNFADSTLEHVIFLGREGAGKTAALRSCAISLALSSRQSQIQMLFIDAQCDRPETPLGPGLHALHYLPHVLAAVVTDADDVADVLGYLDEEAGYRRTHAVRSPTIVVFVDNVDALLAEEGQSVRKPLQNLLARGAESGIHCVMAARPPAHTGNDALSNLLALKPLLRIVGAVDDARQAEAAALLAQSGAENLLGKGDFLIARQEQPVRYQAAYVDAYDLHWTLETLQRNRPPTILARPTPARPTYTSTTNGHGVAQSFSFDGRQISVEPDAQSPPPR